MSKPVTVQVEGMAASAAYYVASQAQRIVAGPGDLIGSIGVRMVVIDSSEYYASMGVKVIPIDTGPLKSAGLEGTPVTDEHIAEFEKITGFYFGQFKAAVGRGRGMDSDAVDAVATGAMFPVNEARRLRLIDSIGTLADTLSAMRPKGRSVETARRQLRL
jgi:protease-4